MARYKWSLKRAKARDPSIRAHREHRSSKGRNPKYHVLKITKERKERQKEHRVQNELKKAKRELLNKIIKC